MELMIIIVILGVLAGLISGNYISALKKGRDAKRKSDLVQIKNALEMYYEDQRTYPDFDIFTAPNLKLCQTIADETCPSGEKVYMQNIPDDPLGDRDYKYVQDPALGTFFLYACLENKEQILPYTSALSPAGGFDCTNTCLSQNGATSITCIYGISSPNTKLQ